MRRPVPAAKVPFVNFANEYLLRSDHRVLLVQIVHHDEQLDQLGTELRRTIETIEIN